MYDVIRLAGVAQWQSPGFVNQLLQVRLLSPAPYNVPGRHLHTWVAACSVLGAQCLVDPNRAHERHLCRIRDIATPEWVCGVDTGI